MGILGGYWGLLCIARACVGSQVSCEMFKRYVAAHINRQFTWLHKHNMALTEGLQGAYTWSHVAPMFLPSTAWVLEQCRSIHDKSAAPQVPMRMWQSCASRTTNSSRKKKTYMFIPPFFSFFFFLSLSLHYFRLPSTTCKPLKNTFPFLPKSPLLEGGERREEK